MPESKTQKFLHTLVIATGNQHKLDEIATHCQTLGLQLRLRSIREWVEKFWVDEDGESFAENALLKATAAAELCGLPVLADDSGLVVDALGGEPGVHSAYYAGLQATDAENNAKLLQALHGVAFRDRTARFVCHLTLLMPDGERFDVEERVEGRIMDKLQGGHGFGYDPLFWVDERGTTLGSLPMHEKNKLSHRARAIQALLKKLQNVGLLH